MADNSEASLLVHFRKLIEEIVSPLKAEVSQLGGQVEDLSAENETLRRQIATLEAMVDAVSHPRAAIRFFESDFSGLIEKLLREEAKMGTRVSRKAPSPNGLIEGIINALDDAGKVLDRESIFGGTNIIPHKNGEIEFDLGESVSGAVAIYVYDARRIDEAAVAAATHDGIFNEIFYNIFILAATQLAQNHIEKFVEAAKRNGAVKTIAIVLNAPDGRMDRPMHGRRMMISAAHLLQRFRHYDVVVTAEPHAIASLGAINKKQLYAIGGDEIFTAQFWADNDSIISDAKDTDVAIECVNKLFDKIILGAPDGNAMKRAEEFAVAVKRMGAGLIAEMHGGEAGTVEKALNRVHVCGANKSRNADNQIAKQLFITGTLADTKGLDTDKPLRGRKLYLVDDIGDSFGTATGAIKTFKQMGAEEIDVYVTHFVGRAAAIDTVLKAGVGKLVITDSNPLSADILARVKHGEEAGNVLLIPLARTIANIILHTLTPVPANISLGLINRGRRLTGVGSNATALYRELKGRTMTLSGPAAAPS